MLQHPYPVADEWGVRSFWTRVPWTPRRLVPLAIALGTLWIGSALIGAPTRGQTALCDVGGPCDGVYAKTTLHFVGALAGIFALALVGVAAVRLARGRYAAPRKH